MTTRDEIIDLVRKCAEPDGDFGIDNAIAFFHAAQRQAYERAVAAVYSVDEYSLGWVSKPDAMSAIRALIEGDEK